MKLSCSCGNEYSLTNKLVKKLRTGKKARCSCGLYLGKRDIRENGTASSSSQKQHNDMSSSSQNKQNGHTHLKSSQSQNGQNGSIQPKKSADNSQQDDEDVYEHKYQALKRKKDSLEKKLKRKEREYNDVVQELQDSRVARRELEEQNEILLQKWEESQDKLKKEKERLQKTKEQLKELEHTNLQLEDQLQERHEKVRKLKKWKQNVLMELKTEVEQELREWANMKEQLSTKLSSVSELSSILKEFEKPTFEKKLEKIETRMEDVKTLEDSLEV